MEQNGGAPGVDGIPTERLRDQCRAEWGRIRQELLTGAYQPQPVRRVEIPKPGGGVRLLGIPTVMDRLIQQALLQVLTPLFDPTFSPSSFGFRPGRRGHDAVRQARRYVEEGYAWVVDLDLEKFFDRVNHDVLMARVARRIRDKTGSASRPGTANSEPWAYPNGSPSNTPTPARACGAWRADQ